MGCPSDISAARCPPQTWRGHLSDRPLCRRLRDYGRNKAHADALWDEVADVIAPLGLRLSVQKTQVCHLDEGFDFLGFRIQRRRKKGTNKAAVYTYPSNKALLPIMAKVRAMTKKTRHHGLADLLGRLNPVRRGWCCVFRHGVSKATFGYLDPFAWNRVTQWLQQTRTNENTGLLRQYFPKGSDFQHWTSEQLHQLAAELNDRPRKTLDDHTPHQLVKRSHRQEHTQPIRIDH